ncbi:MAG TPA: aminotransferase class V-fold PLP-dependent enzyme [Gemmatimonadales bacterium]|nr:aminotransferase class V-fold PLP-dependent enzyme [Gemmatimonadales bacterium]
MTLDRRTFLASTAASFSVAAAFPVVRSPESLSMLSPDDDPLGVRADFPVVTTRTFLNGAYITPSPQQAIQAGQAFLQSKARPMNVGTLLRKCGEVRGQFARLVNATPEEIGFLYATTEGENVVANTVPMERGDNVVMDELAYDGAFPVYRELERRKGVELRIVPHAEGAVTPEAIAARVDRRTKLVTVSWVSHLNGYRHDLKALADIAHRHGALLHTDAIQGIGTLAFDVRATDVDFACAGTYKGLLAGFGLAPFYVRKELHDRLVPDRFGSFGVARELPDHRYVIEPDARRYDYATLPFAEVYQLGTTLGYLERVGVARVEAHVTGLALRLQEGLRLQGFRLFTPPGTRSAIVSFYVRRPEAEVQAAMDAASIDVTVREDHVRASISIFNNAAEVDRLLEVTRGLL